MRRLISKLRLREGIDFEINIDKNAFFDKLTNIVDIQNPDLLEPLPECGDKYKGTINGDNFVIRKKKKFFDFGFNFATIKGTCIENDSKLIIENDIIGFRGWPKAIFLGFLIVYIIYFSGYLVSFLSGDYVYWTGLFYSIIHMFIMLSILYLAMILSIKKTIKHYKQDIIDLIKKNE